MKVFLTGGTGYVGSAVLAHLRAAGHDVAALARSAESADNIARAGGTPVHGDLADTHVLEDAAARTDAVVHAAVDYSGSEEAVAVELAAVRALLAGAGAGDARTPFVYSSSGLVYGFDPTASRDEDAELPEVSAQPVKAAAERLVRDADGVAGVILRPGLVYGRGGSLLVTSLIELAAGSGHATYVGDGQNTWTPVHVDDLARLYVAAVERPVAGIYNVVGADPFSFRDLAEAIAALTGATAVSLPLEEAQGVMGPLAQVTSTTSSMKATKARSTFDWTPTAPSFVDDVRAGSYRVAASA